MLLFVVLLFYLYLVCAQAKLPLPHATSSVVALADRISQLQGWPGRLPVCRGAWAQICMRRLLLLLQFSAGLKLSVTPWHQASYIFMCFSFKSMFHLVLHVFHLDVAYGTLAIHVCCKYIFQMFHLKQMYVASVLSVCFICCNDYTRMLDVYVWNVSFVSNVCCKYFI
jgi:hypothetical protein